AVHRTMDGEHQAGREVDEALGIVVVDLGEVHDDRHAGAVVLADRTGVLVRAWGDRLDARERRRWRRRGLAHGATHLFATVLVATVLVDARHRRRSAHGRSVTGRLVSRLVELFDLVVEVGLLDKAEVLAHL